MSTIASTADLLETILTLVEPYRTNFKIAWLRLRELDRALKTGISITPTKQVRRAGLESMKRTWAREAVRQFHDVNKAAASLGIDRTTLYRWLKEAA